MLGDRVSAQLIERYGGVSAERLVREARVLVVAAFVDTREVTGKVERPVDEGAGALVVVVVLGDLRFDAVELGPETGLELFELFEGERVGEVGFEELVLFFLDLGAAGGEVFAGLVGACGELVELLKYG